MKALLASLALLAAATPLAAAAEQAAAPRIVVNGEGEFAAAPDMAVLGLTVMRQGETARAALDANNAAMAEVIAALKAEGIEARDLQTANFNISPRWFYPQNPDGSPTQEQPRIVGYDVFNGLTVRVRDLARLGTILDRSVTLGVNQGGQVSFTNDNPAAVLKEARKAAVADALDKAKTLAEAAGVGVGRILEMTETNFMPQPVPMMEAKMAMARDAAPVPIEAGENVWRVNVTVTFEIRQ